MQDDCTARSQCILGNGFTHSVQSLGQTHPVSDWISTLKNKQYNHRKVGCPPVCWQRIPIAAPAKWKSAQTSLGGYNNCNSFFCLFVFSTNQTLNVKWNMLNDMGACCSVQLCVHKHSTIIPNITIFLIWYGPCIWIMSSQKKDVLSKTIMPRSILLSRHIHKNRSISCFTLIILLLFHSFTL